MDFQKFGPDVLIKDYELEAIMKANTLEGMTWAPMAYDNPDSPNQGLAKAMESFVAVGQSPKTIGGTTQTVLMPRGPVFLSGVFLYNCISVESQKLCGARFFVIC